MASRIVLAIGIQAVDGEERVEKAHQLLKCFFCSHSIGKNSSHGPIFVPWGLGKKFPQWGATSQGQLYTMEGEEDLVNKDFYYFYCNNTISIQGRV